VGLDGAVRAHRWPAALVPAAAVRTEPTERRAAGPIDAGTPITGALLERQRSDRRHVALPLPHVHLVVAEGDRVDVWATGPATSADEETSTTRRIAVDARVVDASDGAVVVDLPAGQVAAVADAAATATITLVGVP
jgi:hypothetical protein